MSMSQRKVAAAPVHTRMITSMLGFPSSPGNTPTGKQKGLIHKINYVLKWYTSSWTRLIPGCVVLVMRFQGIHYDIWQLTNFLGSVVHYAHTCKLRKETLLCLCIPPCFTSIVTQQCPRVNSPQPTQTAWSCRNYMKRPNPKFYTDSLLLLNIFLMTEWMILTSRAES